MLNLQAFNPSRFATQLALYEGVRMRILIIIVAFALALPMQARAQQPPGDDAVVQWTAKAMTDIMSFDFDNYDKKKEQNRKYFTQHGYDGFYEAMDHARIPQ